MASTCDDGLYPDAPSESSVESSEPRLKETCRRMYYSLQGAAREFNGSEDFVARIKASFTPSKVGRGWPWVQGRVLTKQSMTRL